MRPFVKRQAELEVHIVQLQSHVDIALNDKKQAENDLDMMREKLRVTLQEKIEIENNFNLIQKHEMKRLSELEQKFEDISEQYVQTKEENHKLRISEGSVRKRLMDSEAGRLNFKEQYMEMR